MILSSRHISCVLWCDYKQLEYKKAEAGMNEGAVSGAQEVKKAEVTAMDYDM